MKRSTRRIMIGLMSVGLLASTSIGCTQTVHVPADQMARIEAAANKAEASANSAAASAKAAADSAARADATATKIGSSFSGHLKK
jgi:hypothetical protein